MYLRTAAPFLIDGKLRGLFQSSAFQREAPPQKLPAPLRLLQKLVLAVWWLEDFCLELMLLVELCFD